MKKFLNEVIIKLRWVDIDCYAHLNNSKYFDYMIEARADIFDYFTKEIPSIKYILVDAQCSFKKEVKYPSSLVLKQFSVSTSHTSFELSYEFYNESKLELVAIGKSKLICFDSLNNKITKIPKPVHEMLIK